MRKAEEMRWGVWDCVMGRGGRTFWEERKNKKYGKTGEKLNHTVFAFSTTGIENLTSSFLLNKKNVIQKKREGADGIQELK